MDLTQELNNQLSAFADGKISLSDVHDWISQHAEELASSDDPETRKLDSLTWALLSEYGYGHRTEASARQIIGRELQPAARKTFISVGGGVAFYSNTTVIVADTLVCGTSDVDTTIQAGSEQQTIFEGGNEYASTRTAVVV